MDKPDHDVTYFLSHHKIYRFISIPIGLQNVSCKFQHTVNIILPAVEWQFTLILRRPCNVAKVPKLEECTIHVNEVLILINIPVVMFKLMKRWFFTETVHCLGHNLRLRRLKIESWRNWRKDTVSGLKITRNLTYFCPFLGLHNVFQRFCPATQD